MAAGLVAVAGQADAATYNNHLLVGFSDGLHADFIYDLGASSTALTGAQSWNLSSYLGDFTLGSVSWGVIGSANQSGSRTSWSTVGIGLTPNTIPNTSAWGKINTANSSIYSGFATDGDGSFATPSAQDANSWNQQTINGASFTAYHNVYGDPNVQGTIGADFFSAVGNGSDPELLGTFTLSSGGSLSFSVIPEPSTCSLLTGLGFGLALLRRRSAGKA